MTSENSVQLLFICTGLSTEVLYYFHLAHSSCPSY